MRARVLFMCPKISKIKSDEVRRGKKLQIWKTGVNPVYKIVQCRTRGRRAVKMLQITDFVAEATVLKIRDKLGSAALTRPQALSLGRMLSTGSSLGQPWGPD